MYDIEILLANGEEATYEDVPRWSLIDQNTHGKPERLDLGTEEDPKLVICSSNVAAFLVTPTGGDADA